MNWSNSWTDLDSLNGQNATGHDHVSTSTSDLHVIHNSNVQAEQSLQLDLEAGNTEPQNRAYKRRTLDLNCSNDNPHYSPSANSEGELPVGNNVILLKGKCLFYNESYDRSKAWGVMCGYKKVDSKLWRCHAEKSRHFAY